MPRKTIRKETVPPLMPKHMGQRANGYAPSGFSTLKNMTPEMSEVIERQALEIFTAMANAGHAFRNCLAAIYLTGLNDAIKLSREEGREHEQGQTAATQGSSVPNTRSNAPRERDYLWDQRQTKE